MRKKIDLVQQTVEIIEQWINEGKYKDMDLLPSEGDISVQLEVSRATARDAIRVLEVRGFVERIHGVGVKVNNRSSEVAISFLTDMIRRNNISFDELLEIRRLIEPKASALAAVSASEEEIETLESCVKVMETETSSDQDNQDSDFLFHKTIAKASGNRLLYTIVSSYRSLLFDQIYAANLSGVSTELTHHSHRKILECIKVNDEQGAYDETCVHLGETEKNLISN